MLKSPESKNHREANNQKSRFGLKFRLAVAFVLGVVVGGMVVNKCSDSDTDQPKQPGIADTGGAQGGEGEPDGEGDGPKPPKKSNEKEPECSEFTDEDILRMAENIKRVRAEWKQKLEELTRRSKPEPEVSPEDQELIHLLKERKYKEAVELLDTEEILYQAKNSGSEKLEEAITKATKIFEDFKVESHKAKNRDEELQALSTLLCKLLRYRDIDRDDNDNDLGIYYFAREYRERFPDDDYEETEKTLYDYSFFEHNGVNVKRVIDILFGNEEDLSEYIENNPVLKAFYNDGNLWLIFQNRLAKQLGLHSIDSLRDEYEKYGCGQRAIDIYVFGAEDEESQ